MADDISIAEQHGMPFEERCALAQDYLASTWSTIHGLADVSLKQLREDDQAAQQFLATVSPKSREFFASMSEELRRSLAETEERYRARFWGETCRACADMYGRDARDFALEVLNRQHRSN